MTQKKVRQLCVACGQEWLSPIPCCCPSPHTVAPAGGSWAAQSERHCIIHDNHPLPRLCPSQSTLTELLGKSWTRVGLGLGLHGWKRRGELSRKRMNQGQRGRDGKEAGKGEPGRWTEGFNLEGRRQIGNVGWDKAIEDLEYQAKKFGLCLMSLGSGRVIVLVC